MEGITSLTIDIEVYKKYKDAFDNIKNKRHAINFDGKSLPNYQWVFYTKSEALNEMAWKYKTQRHHYENRYIIDTNKLKDEIKELKLKLLWNECKYE